MVYEKRWQRLFYLVKHDNETVGDKSVFGLRKWPLRGILARFHDLLK